TAEHRPGAASRRSLRAYASSGAFQRPLQRLNSLLQGGPLFRGQTTRPVSLKTTQGEEMLEAEEVAAMLRLHGLGWGARRLAQEFGCARNTVRRYIREGGAVPFRRPGRRTAFDGLDDWLR